ncbi:MAG: PspA/IM30 family protein [Thomasclavelia sp.]
MESFERYEKKAEKMLDAATAEAELNTHTSAASTLADKYTSNGSDASVEDELAAMKAKLDYNNCLNIHLYIPFCIIIFSR